MKHAQEQAPVIEPLSRTEAFAEAISTAKRRHPHLVELARQGKLKECFAVAWKDPAGTCEYAGVCGVSKDCHAAWTDAQELQRHVVPRAAPGQAPATPVAHEPPPMPDAPSPAIPRKRRGTTYTAERPVDRAIEHFMHALGEPAVLPSGWQPQDLDAEHQRRGRIVCSQTSSYTSILIDGEMRMRFWTNAAGRAIVDMVDELVIPARKIVGGVFRIPKGSQKKSRPCSYRVGLRLHDESIDDVLEELATAVVKTFHLERPIT